MEKLSNFRPRSVVMMLLASLLSLSYFSCGIDDSKDFLLSHFNIST